MYRKRKVKPKPDLQKILEKLRNKRIKYTPVTTTVTYAPRDIEAARKILDRLKAASNEISSIKIESRELEEPNGL